MIKLVKSGLTLVGLVVVTGWLYQSPHRAFRQLREAANRGDTGAMARHVDYDSLRASLRSELEARAKGEESGALGVLRGVVVGAVAGVVGDAVVDRLATPENLTLLLRGDRSVVEGPGGSREKERAALEQDAVDYAMGYEGWHRFRVRARRTDAVGAVEMVLVREGLLGWTLKEVRLP